MKTEIIYFLAIILSQSVSAQWVVSDPTNLAQSVINTARTVGQSEATRGAVLENVANTEKIFEQTRQYYEYLRTVNSYIKDVYEVKHTIEMAAEITSLYNTNIRDLASNPLYKTDEISAITFGYSKILEKCASALADLKSIVGTSRVSMTDKERLDVIERCHDKMLHYHKLLDYYTKKVQSVGMIRQETENSINTVISLYK